jgi:aspartyl-tRNA(Asn)/glutamyl-tRNA(Gln) amidotransferase subunit B
MRFDVNISIAPKGALELGTRAEVKNLNSFRSVERAAEYEFRRQVERVEKGERIIQETRGWDDAKQKTSSQRSKEDAQDYRYMPDADIPPIVLGDEEIEKIQATMPKLPSFYRESWKVLDLDPTVINSLLSLQEVAIKIQSILINHGPSAARRTSLWTLTLFNDTTENEANSKLGEFCRTTDTFFNELATMVDDNRLSSTTAKLVFAEMIGGSVGPQAIAESKNLIQESDEDAIASIVDEVLADPTSIKSIQDIKEGNDKAIGFLVGQVMKKSQGKANPALAQKLIRERL